MAAPQSSALDLLAVQTIKMLAVDAVERANSGHPGMPMGASDMAYVLWTKFFRSCASNPSWPNRDRFILSAGHGCMLLYSLLHLSGFDLSMEDLKNFRQWESKTPGHPEFGHTVGVECTTGPLGQGVANGVGMAIAEKLMQARFKTEKFTPIDHYIYAICSDGDLMEGVASEAASVAGHLGLGNMIYLYDDNHITIDGNTEITFSENVASRYLSYGWHVQTIDGHDHGAISNAIEKAQEEKNKPSLILARTIIGKDAAYKENTPECHGAPLGKEEVLATKKKLNWPLEPTFFVPQEVSARFAERRMEMEHLYQDWETKLLLWKEENPQLAQDWERTWKKEVPENLFKDILEDLPEMPDATRTISHKIQQKVAKLCPSLVGAGADLTSSTKVFIKDSPYISKNSFQGRNIHFGIREHAMASAMNGLAYYGGWIPFSSTFLIFSDYMRPAIRLAALSQLQNLFVFSHDSIFVGEDGPTHQPVETLSSLRLIPNLHVIRPADSMECAAAWQMALSRKNGPTAICLTRQKLPKIEREPSFKAEDILRGGYIVSGAETLKPDCIIIGTGSELHLAVEAKVLLAQKGLKIRVVSIPCVERFAEQSEAYRELVLPTSKVPTAVVEAGVGDLWYRWVGRGGLVLGLNRFGASAPGEILAEKFDFTPSAVAARVEKWIYDGRKS